MDAWLCSNDSTAQGVIQALEENYTGKTWPVVTGQNCDIANVKYIIEGKKQAESVRPCAQTAEIAKTLRPRAQGFCASPVYSSNPS